MKQNDADIDDLRGRVAYVVDGMAGESVFAGMSYEEGIAAAVDWIIGETNTHPLDV